MIGENIKTYRQKKGYTQEEVANRLHVTRQTISKWEKNYSVPDAEVFVKFQNQKMQEFHNARKRKKMLSRLP